MKLYKALACMLLGSIVASSASAQVVDSTRTILLTGVYGVSTAPRVLVLPMNFPSGDSIRAIIVRDFAYGNSIDTVPHADSIMLPTRDEPDYAYFQQLGIAALVHVVPTMSGISATLYDVTAKRNAGSQGFALPSLANTPEWRWALHGVSDEIHEWIVRSRGIAQTRIAFIRGGSLWVVDSDGEHEREIERGMLLSPDWHPTQPVLAFGALVRQSAWQIGVKSLTGGATRWLTTNPHGSNMAPAFSPDGNHVYFQRSDNDNSGIWIVPFASAGTARSIMMAQSPTASPAPSPQGDRIMFVSGRTGNQSLYTMSIDGTNQSQFIATFGVTKTYLESPAWSPDGSKVAYAARRGSDSAYQIETADVRSRGPVARTNSGENEGPSWAANSRHIVFESNRSGTVQLWILDTESGRARQLTHGPGGAKNAAWSPRYR